MRKTFLAVAAATVFAGLPSFALAAPGDDSQTALYRTPVGRKLMATIPAITAEGMASAEQIMAPRLGKLMQETMQERQKQ